MNEVFLSIVTVMAVSFSTSAMVFPSAMGSAHRVDIVLAQSVDQQVPSDQGTPQEETGPSQSTPQEETVPSQSTPQGEMGSGQGAAQDAGSSQPVCTTPADCPGQNENTPPDSNITPK